ncbi:MAG: hypothetical protein M3Z24_12735 [Chloroflexota bacterium]|nr:hypothetical protein [Chloroflexota bacterium]
MAYEMNLKLTEQEYAALAAEAAKNGKQPEMLLHEMIEHLRTSSLEKRTLTGKELAEQLYCEGKIDNIPTRRPLTAKEKAEREYLAQRAAGGKSASEMVIEDRGPY